MNERYTIEDRASTFNLKTLYQAYIDNLIQESFVNYVINPELKHVNISSGPTEIFFGWFDSSLAELSGITRNAETRTFTLNEDEFIFQDLDANIEHGKDYTLLFQGSSTEELFVEVDGGSGDMINLDDLTQVGRATMTIPADASDLTWYAVSFRTTVGAFSGIPFRLKIRSQTTNTTITFRKIAVKSGLLHIPGVYSVGHFESNTRYNESTEQWEITHDGITYGALGAGSPGDVKTTVSDMITGNTETGIDVTYDAGSQTFDFAVKTPTLSLNGDATGTAVLDFELAQIDLTVTVDPSGHLHAMDETNWVTPVTSIPFGDSVEWVVTNRGLGSGVGGAMTFNRQFDTIASGTHGVLTTTITLAEAYDPGELAVYVDGVRQSVLGEDYTENGPGYTTFTFDPALPDGTEVLTITADDAVPIITQKQVIMTGADEITPGSQRFSTPWSYQNNQLAVYVSGVRLVTKYGDPLSDVTFNTPTTFTIKTAAQGGITVGATDQIQVIAMDDSSGVVQYWALDGSGDLMPV